MSRVIRMALATVLLGATATLSLGTAPASAHGGVIIVQNVLPGGGVIIVQN